MEHHNGSEVSRFASKIIALLRGDKDELGQNSYQLIVMNPSRKNGSRRQIKGRRRFVRNEDNPGMALQFSNTYRFPSRTQIHRVVE